ncbi:MAG: hypothetical protein EZS28_018985 [Streblomastix strix]|uniref:Uncharacterized protein n=1 Tax=Streblomastix strix TaxID=222440 RepID=A0A5J4VS97_9EUKA|nr:MAG: hypothetical protein EZS28_018985 [Streblomastix strix]
MQEAAEQFKQDICDSGRPALVSLPSMQPQVAPAEVVTQQSMSVLADDEAQKLYIHRNLAFVSSALLSITGIMAAMDPKKMICTEPFLYYYMKTFDKLLLLNELFNRKESPWNEISYRKRVMTTTSRTDWSYNISRYI